MRRFIFKAFTLSVALLATTSYAEFKSQDEVSLVSTGGNTNIQTYNAKTTNSFEIGLNKFGLNGNYIYGEADEVRNAERWDATLRYDRTLFDSLSLFLAEFVESNRYAGFSRRFNTDIGAKYDLVKTKKNQTFIEAGYRYTIEKKKDESIPDQKDSKARAYAETNHAFNDNFSIKFWIEYIPNFTESEDYLINAGPSLSAALSKIFSLKVGYLWNYDNLPVPGSGKHDYTLTTGLIANF